MGKTEKEITWMANVQKKTILLKDLKFELDTDQKSNFELSK